MKAFGQNYEKHPNYIIQYPMGTNQIIIPQISNSNLIITGYNSVAIQNNCQVNAIYNPAQISNQNIIIQKPIQSFNVNQVLPLNNLSSHLKQNITNLENNISQMKINKLITSKMKNESYTGHKPIPVKLVNKTIKSICKIIVNINNKTHSGTGFFMKVSNSLKFLITNYHVIYPELIKQNIDLEIWNKKSMKLELERRYTKFINQPKDITAIEIKESDEIYKEIVFLNYDRNYIEGYSIYKNVDVFTIEHPLGKSAASASGKILRIDDNEFCHDISTDVGSSGCPIILLNNNMNLIQVIGIHKNSDKKNKINFGTFIGDIISEINKDFMKHKNYKFNLALTEYPKIYSTKCPIDNSVKEAKAQIKNNDNYIIAEIYIKKEKMNDNIRIINSYEERMRKCTFEKFKEDFKIENEIKECEIKINDKLIPFNYYHKFIKKGKYTIKYTFKNYLDKTNFMFHDCSLTMINLSNFNTKNVTNMEQMFSCSSLISIDLSNFNTQNVTNMNGMFFQCVFLKSLNVSNFSTINVTDMSYMFHDCSSLTNIDLSNFNTPKVTNLNWMFYGCSSLTSINLSNFNTQNVIDMVYTFSRCRSLTSLDLSNFNIQNDTHIYYIFSECSSLKKQNIITKDKRIIEQFIKFKY